MSDAAAATYVEVRSISPQVFIVIAFSKRSKKRSKIYEKEEFVRDVLDE